MLWLDPYERHARLVPGLLALLPIAVLSVAVGLRDAPVVATLISLLSLAGGPVLLAAFVRQRGVDAQTHLWGSWGGSPTVQALRATSTFVSAPQRDRWREAVQRVTGVALLSARAEAANRQKADETIDVAVGDLREKTRDRDRFPLVWAEVKNYGFERNFYGMREVGIAIAVVSSAATLSVTVWRATDHQQIKVVLVGAVADLVLLFAWTVLPSEARTRSTADKYARQLLQAAVVLDQQPPN
jgi:hypothetical protein